MNNNLVSNEVLSAVTQSFNPMGLLFDRSDVIFGADNCGHILNKIENVLEENHLDDDVTMLKNIVVREATRQLRLTTIRNTHR